MWKSQVDVIAYISPRFLAQVQFGGRKENFPFFALQKSLWPIKTQLEVTLQILSVSYQWERNFLFNIRLNCKHYIHS